MQYNECCEERERRLVTAEGRGKRPVLRAYFGLDGIFCVFRPKQKEGGGWGANKVSVWFFRSIFLLVGRGSGNKVYVSNLRRVIYKTHTHTHQYQMLCIWAFFLIYCSRCERVRACVCN